MGRCGVLRDMRGDPDFSSMGTARRLRRSGSQPAFADTFGKVPEVARARLISAASPISISTDHFFVEPFSRPLAHIQPWERARVRVTDTLQAAPTHWRTETMCMHGTNAGSPAPSPITRLASANRAPTSPGMLLRTKSAGACETGLGRFWTVPSIAPPVAADR